MIKTDKTIQLRQLGKTDIKVTPIGLGGNKFSGGKGLSGMMYPDVSQEMVNGIIGAALEGGINWFDTAEIYGFGNSERAISTALKAAGKGDDEVIIATKWSPFLRTARNIPQTIDKRLQCLNGYSIDLFMVHFPYGFSSLESEMDAMANLVEAGKIRSVGVSNYNVGQMRRAYAALEKRGLPLAVNQVSYSLLNRKIEVNGELDAAKELGVTIIAYYPLGAGILSGKYHQNPETFDKKPFIRRKMLRRRIKRSRPLIEVLENIAVEGGVTVAQVALNWLLNIHGEKVVAIPGASKAYQAEQSAGAMKFRLSEEEMARLEKLTHPSRSVS